MSVLHAAVRRESSSKPIVVAALAALDLAMSGRGEVSPTFLVAIAIIVVGVGSLLYGAAPLSQLKARLASPSTAEGVLGGFSSGWSTIIPAGVASIVLGILALLAGPPAQLVAIASIAFGPSLLISGNPGTRILAASRENVDRTLGSEPRG
jgi:sugar phosphate permease